MTAAGSDGVLIGLDLGTSGLKGIALDASGALIGRASASYPTARPAPLAAEQDPGHWLDAIERVAAALAAHADPGRWAAIGLSAMLPTLVTADAAGRAIGPAITWEDSRAERQADQLRDLHAADREAGGPGQLYAITGQWVDGRYLLPMFARLAREDPGRAVATRWLLGAKDYLYWWLTGTVATDPSTATGFGCFGLSAGTWDAGALAAGAAVTHPDGRAMPGLPPVLASAATRPLRGEIASRLRCGRIPVCLGAADSVLGALGLGARSAGQVAYVAGTSTVILGVADHLMLDPEHRYLVTPLAHESQWGLEMDLLATGSALRWLAMLLGDGLDEAGVVALAAQVDPLDAPVVLPYLSPGEQGALWDPALSGAITGLSLAHDRRHLARGLVNGLILESRRCLGVLAQASRGLPETPAGPAGVSGAAAEVLVAGGSAAAPSFRADLADATGSRVVRPAGQDTDFSARGAALLAAESIGRPVPGHPLEPDAAITSPDPDRAATWDRLWLAHEHARTSGQAAAR
jgi:xylulokinase